MQYISSQYEMCSIQIAVETIAGKIIPHGGTTPYNIIGFFGIKWKKLEETCSILNYFVYNNIFIKRIWNNMHKSILTHKKQLRVLHAFTFSQFYLMLSLKLSFILYHRPVHLKKYDTVCIGYSIDHSHMVEYSSWNSHNPLLIARGLTQWHEGISS